MFIKNKFYSILLILLLSVFFLLINRFVPRWHKIESFSNFNEIKADFSGRVSRQVSVTDDNASELYDQAGQQNFFICRDKVCQVTYSFSQPTNIKKINILYQGNFSQEKEVAFHLDDDIVPFKNIVKNCSSTNGLCSYYFDNQSKIYNFKLVLNNAEKKNYGIREIKFYNSQTKNIFSSIFDYFFIWPRSYSSYLIYPIFFFLIFLLPGLFFSSSKIIFTLTTSTIIFSFLSLLSIFLPAVVIKEVIIIGLIWSIFFLCQKYQQIKTFLEENKLILLIYFISLIVLSSFMYIKDHPKDRDDINVFDYYANYQDKNSQVPYGTYEVDYLIPYHSAINYFLGGDFLKEKIGTIYNLTDRTPLISFITIFYGKAFGLNVFIYQMLIVALANLFIISTFKLARLFLNNIKSALIALAFSFSHFFIYTTLFSPGKTICLFFIVAGAYYLLKPKKEYYQAGLLIALGYLFHPYILVYFISFLIYLVGDHLNNKGLKNILRNMTIFILPLLTAFVLWTTFSSFLKQNSSIYLSVFIGQTWSESSKLIAENKQASDLKAFFPRIFTCDFWKNKLLNLVGLFIFLDIGPESRLLDYFKSTIFGALGLFTPILFFIKPIYLLLTKNVIKINKQIRILFIYFIISPILLSVFYQGFYIRMGLMWYALGILPFYWIIFSSFYNNLTLMFFILLALVEGFFILFIYDITEYNRIAISYFGSGNLLFKLGFICFYLIIINLLFFILIKRLSTNK